MIFAHRVSLFLALFGFLAFFFTSQLRVHSSAHMVFPGDGRVVVAAPILLVLFGGDRFLAANLETMRLAATGMSLGQADVGYLMRSQGVVSELNPCHEDNYYLANGLLAWGGAEAQGNEILRRAMNCRFWDELPAFFYGFNQSFFKSDIAEAARALELAAQRSNNNAAGFRKLAVMLQAESFADEKLALEYLVRQRDAASADPKLQQMLDKRVVRLQGLVTLRDAQRRFEVDSGPLVSLQQLVEAGVIAALPDDPLRLGYELRSGRIILKKLKIAGVEEEP